jgi:hypothetical protein
MGFTKVSQRSFFFNIQYDTSISSSFKKFDGQASAIDQKFPDNQNDRTTQINASNIEI